jgi:RNA polymerase sigma factor (sigma-70 family)
MAVQPESETTFTLVERAKAGDIAATERLFARYLPRLSQWARGRLPRWARDLCDTQDLVQETLFQTLRNIEGFTPRHEGALQAYLRQAVRNRIVDEVRRAKRRGDQEPLDSQHEDGGPSPLDAAIGTDAAERYERALQRLRPEDRELIIARVELGCSYEEVAQALNKPTVSAARKAAQRALLRLTEEMRRDRAVVR